MDTWYSFKFAGAVIDAMRICPLIYCQDVDAFAHGSRRAPGK
jgi:hypothetical protein